MNRHQAGFRALVMEIPDVPSVAFRKTLTPAEIGSSACIRECCRANTFRTRGRLVKGQLAAVSTRNRPFSSG
jgi:hypothetical protein